MKTKATLFVIALSGIGASCGTIPADYASVLSTTHGACTDSTESSLGAAGRGINPVPVGETAGNAVSQFVHLHTFDTAAIAVHGDNEIGAGRFVGNLVLEQKRASVKGAGFGQTVIDGNLIVGGQCNVTGVTVTGDVIFTGNNARVQVECFGQVLDYGMQNRH
jgi:hypothetical protein